MGLSYCQRRRLLRMALMKLGLGETPIMATDCGLRKCVSACVIEGSPQVHIMLRPNRPAVTPSTHTTPDSISASLRSPRPTAVRMAGPPAPGFGVDCPTRIDILDSRGAGLRVVTRPMALCSRVRILVSPATVYYCTALLMLAAYTVHITRARA